LESLDDKTRRYRDETLQELEALELRVAVLRGVIKTLDDILTPSKETDAPFGENSEKPAPRGTDQKIFTACQSWKTVRQLSDLQKFGNLSKSNISTRCRDLWVRGCLERRQVALPPHNPLNHQEYEYRSLNAGPAFWSGRIPRRSYGDFEKILRQWFEEHDTWYTIHDLKKLIPGFSVVCHANFRPYLIRLLDKGFLEREDVPLKRQGAPREHRYRRKPS